MLRLRARRADHLYSGQYHRTARPNLSAANPRKWNRPLAKGVLPAYDEALKIIRDDSRSLQREVKELRTTLVKAENAHRSNEDNPALIREKLAVLEVQSEINLPHTRWMCANGMANFANPTHLHLLEKRWRTEGTLDLLMERIYQMHIVPDVLPSLRPSVDLRVTFPSSRGGRYQEVEPGVYLLSEQTLGPPKLYANLFHPDTRLYTLLMIDPDVPDEQTRSYQTYVHWLRPNIPLSALMSGRLNDLNSHTSYIPPHPQRGTPYHRYIILLLPQHSATEHISVPKLLDNDRLGFNVRDFLLRYQLDGGKGGGAHIWREVWDTKVSEIYQKVLKTQEPRFVRLPKNRLA